MIHRLCLWLGSTFGDVPESTMIAIQTPIYTDFEPVTAGSTIKAQHSTQSEAMTTTASTNSQPWQSRLTGNATAGAAASVLDYSCPYVPDSDIQALVAQLGTDGSGQDLNTRARLSHSMPLPMYPVHPVNPVTLPSPCMMTKMRVDVSILKDCQEP